MSRSLLVGFGAFDLMARRVDTVHADVQDGFAAALNLDHIPGFGRRALVGEVFAVEHGECGANDPGAVCLGFAHETDLPVGRVSTPEPEGER